MAGLDVASGIAGLIALTLQVSGTIATYATAVKDHSKSVAELQEELHLLSNVLSRLGDFISSETAKGRSFEADSVLVKAISDCKRRIERIGDKIKPSNGGKVARTIDRLKWPFEQKDVLQLVENLRRYIHTFEFAVTIKNSEFLSQSWDDASKSLQDLQTKVDQACETSKMLGEPIEKLLERSQQLHKVIEILPTLLHQSEDLKEVNQAIKLAEQREQERRKADILDWLTPLSTLHKHVELQSRRAPDSCRWLLENEMFDEWAKSESVQYDMLCQGGPGVGKTVLCSMVTDHLRTKYKNDDVAVVHYYFDLAEQQAQTEFNLVRSILRQLCQGFQTIPTAVADFYQSTRHELQDSLWLQELQTILQRVIATFSQCFIIVDAFDEAEARKRSTLLKILRNVKESNGCVKLFATSRPHIVLDMFEDAFKIEVRADDEDLRIFLRHKIDNHPHSAALVDNNLKEAILSRLCQHADGVFLLPALQIDQILDQAVSPGDIFRALDNLSTNLREVFQSTIVRIESFSGGKRDLACKTLMWLSHSRRPLRISELQHAIAVRFDQPDLDQRDISSISVILDSCCGLVELDGESACVRFVHGSIAEYLQTEDHRFFEDAELEIVRVSLKYLAMDQLKDLPFKNRNDFSRSMETYPLLDYASSFWGYHANRLQVSSYQDLALQFLSSSLHLLVTARVRDIKTPEFRKWKERMLAWSVSGGAGISLAASFGLTDLARLLISQSQHPVLSSRNMYGSTPLHECAIFGHTSTAELLIAHGADLLDSNRGKATPFYLAVSYGQLETSKAILKYNRSQLDIQCKQGNTALHKAADLGSDAMIEFLLQAGALTEIPNQLGRTPLHLAAQKGHYQAVQMLVLRGANVGAVDTGLLSPLDLAVVGGHTDISSHLLKQGVTVNHRGKEGWTPLHRAARSGHLKLVKILLAAGANVLAKDNQGAIPFHVAAKSGDLDVVKTILFHDPSLTTQQFKHEDRRGDSAITVAFYTSNYTIYEYLRDMEPEIIGVDSVVRVDPILPLSRAIEHGSLPEVESLLQSHPSWLETRDNFSQTPLHTAFRTRQLSIAEYLLSRGSSINSRGYHGWTPLNIAASTGDIRMLELALQWNADINLVSNTLQSPLHKAASSGSIAVVLELLRCGCLPSSTNDSGMTPAHVAASRNFLDGLLVMIRPEFGGRSLLLTRDNRNRTPRDWADRAGHLELSSILRDEERRAKTPHFDALGSISNRPATATGSHSSLLSRQSTREVPSRQSTSSSLVLPTLERTASIASSGSLAEQSSHYSPRRTPTPSAVTTGPQGSVTHALEQRYAEMQLDFDSE